MADVCRLELQDAPQVNRLKDGKLDCGSPARRMQLAVQVAPQLEEVILAWADCDQRAGRIEDSPELGRVAGRERVQ